MKYTLFFFFSFIVNTAFAMEEIKKIDINDYLKKGKTTALLEAYQCVWNESKNILIKNNELAGDENVCQLIDRVIDPKPSEIINDQKVLSIVQAICSDAEYIKKHHDAETLTLAKKDSEAKKKWAECRFRISQICDEALQKENVNLDIREQAEEPYYDETYDLKNAEIANQFILRVNRYIEKPEKVAPYMLAGMIVTSVEHQKAEKLLFTLYERFGLYVKSLMPTK